MKLNIKKNDGVISLPKGCTSLLSEADASDLKVLIYAAECEAEGKEFSEEDAAEALSLGKSEIKSSIKFWVGAGVLKKGSATRKKEEEVAPEPKKTARRRALPEKRTASFTTNELCEIAEMNEDFKTLIDMAQQTAGWMFNTSEIEIIAALYSNLMLSSEYILVLINYYVCGREKPLRYLEKVAYSFIDDGIDNAQALEEKLRYLEKYEGYEGMVRKLFGLGVRSFIDKERKILRTWLEEYGYGEDIVKAAYEITVNNTGKASLNYANSVLKNWHEEGVKTLDDLKKKEKSPKASGANTTRAGTATARSFNVDDAFTKALERSYKAEEKK